MPTDSDENWVEMPLAEAQSSSEEGELSAGDVAGGEGFGAGRNDEYFGADENAIDPSELEFQEEQPEGLDPQAENWDDEDEQEPLSPDHEDYDPIYGAEARQGEEEEYWEEEPDGELAPVRVKR